MKRLLILSLFLLLAGLVAFFGFADKMTFEQAASADKVGFWYGLLHGLIIVLSFVGSFLSDDIAIYAISNSGVWYDFGFVVGVLIAIKGPSIELSVTTYRTKYK